MSGRERVFGLLERLSSGPGWGLGRFPPLRVAHRALATVARLMTRVLGSKPVPVRAWGLVVHVSPDDRQTGAELIRTGSYEPAETALFEATVRPGMTVVDVGANVGIYTLLAARAVGAEGRVIALEPDPNSFSLLSLNVEANDFGNVTVVRKALAAGDGKVELYRYPGHSGLGSLSRANARGSAESVTVEQTTLDAVLDELGVERVDVLKLDVQGAELEIVSAARDTLSRDRPAIFVEYWPAGLTNFGREPRRLLSLFDEIGYSLRSVDEPDVELGIEAIDDRCRSTGGLDLLALARE